MSGFQLLVMILISALMTVALRFLPFLMFRSRDRMPDFIQWLGKQLPRAVMAMLVIYCLKDINISSASGWAAPLIGVAVTAALHAWKKKMILSITGGTAVYMLLIRLIP